VEKVFDIQGSSRIGVDMEHKLGLRHQPGLKKHLRLKWKELSVFS